MTQQNSTAVQTAAPKQTVASIMASPAMQKKLNDVLGSEKSAASFISTVISVTNGNSYLRNADPMTIVGSAMVAATLNLPVVPTLGMAYIIPYGRQAQFQIGYKGLIQLAERSGQIKNIIDEVVYEGQLVKKNKFTGEYVFDEDAKQSDKVVGYMARLELTNGFAKTIFWTIEEVTAHAQKFSQAFQKGWSSPWKSDFNAMAKKGLALDTKIPTPSGFTTMGDLKIGDEVFNALGQVTKVIAKSEVKHLPCYRITFSNGDSFVCDHEHRWFVNGNNSKTAKRGDWQVLDVSTLYGVTSLGYTVVTPCNPTVELEHKNLILDPWCLGYWLGNGSKHHGNVSCSRADYEYIQSVFERFYNVKPRFDGRNNAVTLSISSKTGLRSDMSALIVQLKEIGVYMDKHIPQDYKRASVEQRRELIRGLCDSDGCAEKKRGRAMFSTVSKQLAYDIYEILSSLGERACVTSRIQKGFGKEVLAYSVQWQPKTFNPFSLPRKAEKIKLKHIRRNNFIKSIEKVESVPTQCIAVDAGDATEENDLRKSYLIGDGFYVTHNTLLKQLINKYAPMDIALQQAIKFDQAVVTPNTTGDNDEEIIIDAFNIDYADNNQPPVEEVTETVDPSKGLFNDNEQKPNPKPKKQ